MINLVGIYKGIPLYEDKYMEDNKVLACRKQGVDGPTFFVANSKTANLIYKTFIIKQRKDKLQQINDKF